MTVGTLILKSNDLVLVGVYFFRICALNRTHGLLEDDWLSLISHPCLQHPNSIELVYFLVGLSILRVIHSRVENTKL